MMQLLFSFHGRIGRARYWLGMFLATAPLLLLATLNDLELIGLIDLPFSYSTLGMLWLIAILANIGLYIASAISSKRLHDRNRTGWWLVPLLFFFFLALPIGPANSLLIYTMSKIMAFAHDILGLSRQSVAILGYVYIAFYIGAFLISLWLFVELAFLRGTKGPNKYGTPSFVKQLD